MIGWGRACIGVGGLLLLGQLLGGALLLADDGEATLAVEHFWLLPAGFLRHRPGPGQALRPAARLSPSRGPACPGLPEAFSFLI